MQLVRVVLILCSLLAAWEATFAVSGAPPVRESEPEIVSPPRLVAGQLLIGFAQELDEAARNSLIAAHGGETISRLDRLAARVVAVRRDLPLGEIARGFAAAPGVRYAEPNAVQHVSTIPSDPSYAEQWALTKIGAPTAWATTTGNPGDEVVVGVVDSGVDYDHPDLAANIWAVPAGQTIDGCGAGTHGYRSIGGLESCDPDDDQGSGTQVAGTIGAVGDNGIGVVGINWHVKIMALNCVDSNGSVQISDAVRIIEYAIAAKEAGVNLRVLSIGWTVTFPSETLRTAIAEAGAAGILVVAAAGQDGDYHDNDAAPRYPASLPNVIAVTATERNDALNRQVYNSGKGSVHLAAPGVDILTTIRGTGYASKSGGGLVQCGVDKPVVYWAA